MEILIETIIIKKRKRMFSETKVAELYQSIGDIGLLNPVTVSKSNKNYTLIAGLHRLEACKKLGWKEIPASVVYKYDKEDATTTMGMELIEIDENLIRNDLTVLEQAEHIQRRNEILKELGLLAESGTNLKNLRRTGDNLSPVKTTEEIASEIGIDERSLQRKQSIATNIPENLRDEIRWLPISDNQSQLLDLARCPEEQQQKIVVFLKDREGASVKDAQKEIKKQERDDKRSCELPDGKYSVIYADPPWQYGNAQHSKEEQDTVLESHYPTMPIEEICALPINTIASDNAVLFLWATSPLLPQALTVIQSWGFEYKASFIWDKIKHNVGYYNSVRHEFLLIAVKGSFLPEKREGEPILFDSVQSIERTRHSEKPGKFREIIEYLYPSGKYIELFARKASANWTVWGNENV